MPTLNHSFLLSFSGCPSLDLSLLTLLGVVQCGSCPASQEAPLGSREHQGAPGKGT